MGSPDRLSCAHPGFEGHFQDELAREKDNHGGKR
jgi:hypothetical protein